MRDLAADGVKTEKPLDAMAGSTLGRLLLRYRANKGDPGAIDEGQYLTGERFGKLVHRYAAIKGIRLRVRTPSFIMVGGGFGGELDVIDADYAEKTSARYNDCYRVVREQSRIHGRNLMRILRAVCVDDMPLRHFRQIDYGDLRTALNALERVI